MPNDPRKVLTIREASSQLPATLERFRQAGANADPVLFGARRRPEAVLLSYERYLQLARGAGRVDALIERQAARIGSGLGDEEAMRLASRELRAMRRERRDA